MEENELIQLYPNPTSGIVHLPSHWVGEELRVTESGGKEVWQEIAQEHLDLSKLPAGTYVFTVKQDHALVFKY